MIDRIILQRDVDLAVVQRVPLTRNEVNAYVATAGVKKSCESRSDGKSD